MAEQKVQNIDDVLRKVDNLFAQIDAEAESYLHSDGEVDAQRMREVGLAALTSLIEIPRDGWAEIRISRDEMVVLADFHPPTGPGRPLSLDAFQLQLEKLGVVYGVLHSQIKAVLLSATTERRDKEEVVVAKGTLPVPARREHWEILPVLKERKRLLDLEAPALDFKNQSPFILVKMRDLLAEKIPEQPGVAGWNVFGKPLDYPGWTPPLLEPGENVIESAEGLRSSCEGSFRFDEKHFWVDQVLVLQSGVGYATGHIDFPGEIHITGEIASGFKIKTKGSIISSRVIDASEIQCGGDIVTPLGIIGREGSVVKAEGSVRAKFLENVYVVSRGSMEIQTSIMNCVLQSQDRLVMGGRGLVMGGRIQAQNGMDLYQVGSERGGKAELICGMDFLALEKITWIRDQSLSLVKQLKILESNKKFHPEKGEIMNKACSQIREQILKLSEAARELATNVDRNDAATIAVRGVVYPGTYIEICHVSHIVGKPVGRVKFSLDKGRNRIQVDSL